MPRYTLLLAGCLLSISSATAQTAQPARLNVSVQGGVIRNLQNEDEGQPLHAFYPEVQIASRPFSLVRGISLQGGLHWGYWDDGVREGVIGENRCFSFLSFCFTSRSHRGHIAGARLYVVPTQIPLVSLSLFSGLSWHFVSTDKGVINVGNGGYSGIYSDIIPRRNYPERFKALEAGLRIAVPLGSRVAITAETQGYFHIFIEEHNPYTNERDLHRSQFAHKLGLSFGFF